MINRHMDFALRTPARYEFFDVTERVTGLIAEAELRTGLVTVFTAHTSCCVMLQEESEDVTYWQMQYILQDTLNVLNKIVPPAAHENQYLHPGPIHIRNAADLRQERPEWGLNTDGHIMSSLLGRSVAVPVEDGRPILGEFGRIYFGDLDRIRDRDRTVRLHLLGD